MILNAFHIFLFYLFYKEAIYDFPFLLGWQFPLPLLHGVMLYYYVSSVTDQFPKKKIHALVHLVPTIITIGYLIHFFILPAEEKIEIFKNEGAGYHVFQKVLLYTVIIWSSLILRKHRERIRSQFSNLEEINLRWLQFLVYGLGGVWSIVLLTQNDIFIFIGASVFVILTGFFGIQQKNIFIAQQVEYKIIEPEKTPIAAVSKEKYVKSGLSEEKEEKYYKKLNSLISEEKFYLDPELSLHDLSSKLDINPNYLSQIINKKENKTFYDYINSYRVNEFKKLIAIPKNQEFTLIAIAYECGFNSKSSFNRYFKKNTGQTPSQYAKALKSS